MITISMASSKWRKQKEKLPVKKKEFRSGKNISRICSETPLKSLIKTVVCSFDGFINFFDIVAGVLQGDTLVPYMFICLDYVLWTIIDLIKENGFILKKTRCSWYHGETNVDYADDLVLLTDLLKWILTV